MPQIPPLPRAPVVYTMGKVGSSSLSYSIQLAGLPCYDIHTLDPDWLKDWSAKRLAAGEFPEPRICEAMAYRDRLLIHPGKCTYITSVREPVARNLSAFFQNYGFMKPDLLRSPDAKAAFQSFMETYPQGQPVSWFKREFQQQLGIDVLALPFDKQQRVFRRGREIVVFRLDTDPKVMERHLSAALGRPVAMVRTNDGAHKDYGDLYAAVREIARFTPDYLDRLYDTRFARAFWTQEELAAFRAYWLGERETMAA